MKEKYKLNTEENRSFLSENANSLLEFGRRFPSDCGASFYLGDDGTPWKERPRETWITCRMAHVYSIGIMKYKNEEYKILAEKAIKGLSGALKDREHGGWYAGITAAGEHLPDKQCYAHAFVILASSSAYLAGINGAKELLDEALKTYDKFFWDGEKGLATDTWDTDFKKLSDYRGLNANMHTVEAFLAVADAMKTKPSEDSVDGETYRNRAGRIIEHVLSWAKENEYRIPEHFTKDWVPDLDMNKDRPDDPFKPYGATPGHGIEWARLITQYALSDGTLSEEKKQKLISEAEKLYTRARDDAWERNGKPGIAYTTDWGGNPVVTDRMHWTLAEAINTSAVLYRTTKKEEYKNDYSEYMEYLDETVMDHKNGSWFHQLDENNNLKGTVWPGKSDLYHAFQSMLIPYEKTDVSIASAAFLC